MVKKTGFSTKELSEAGEAGHSVLTGFRTKMRVVNSSVIIGRSNLVYSFISNKISSSE